MEISASPLLAYRVTIEDMSCVCFADSAPQARWYAVKGYWEAGYGRKGKWPDVHAARAPSWDRHPASEWERGRTHSEFSL